MEFVPLFEEFMDEASKNTPLGEPKFKKFVKGLDPEEEIDSAKPKVTQATIDPKKGANLEKAATELKKLHLLAEKETQKTNELINAILEKQKVKMKQIDPKLNKTKEDVMKMMKNLELAEYTIDNVIIKYSAEHTKRSTSYESIVSTIYEKANPILAGFIEKIFKENSKLNAINAKLELKIKKDSSKLKESTEVNENVLLDLWNKVVNFISTSISSLLGTSENYENVINDIKNMINGNDDTTPGSAPAMALAESKKK